MFEIKIPGGRAQVRIHHEVAYDYDEKTGLWLTKPIDEDELVWNIITDGGRDYLHQQCYATSGLGTNGLNYIALSNDATAPAAGDTTLTGEIVSNGLNRQQGTVSHTVGTNQTTVQKVFTFTGGTQAVQKSALFNLSSSGVMAHEVQFTQRTLNTNDTLTVTYTISLG
jgi:hypothetical protein